MGEGSVAAEHLLRLCGFFSLATWLIAIGGALLLLFAYNAVLTVTGDRRNVGSV